MNIRCIELKRRRSEPFQSENARISPLMNYHGDEIEDILKLGTQAVKARTGISPIIAVVILTGIILTVVSGAIYYSSSLEQANFGVRVREGATYISAARKPPVSMRR